MKLKTLGDWFEKRLQLEPLYRNSAGHAIPRSSASWWYVFGSATLICFVLQIVTGICLALVYVPAADEAWNSLEYLNYQQTFGWFLRAVHYWGSNFMVALMTIHMLQVFLFGAYKYPREFTWVIGCVLFLCTLGLAFTGQVMRFDQDAYWGLGIGASIMGRIPFIGNDLVYLVLGGPIIAGETLSRFFGLHVFVLPGLVILFVVVHLRLVLKTGINDYPIAGKPVDLDHYDEEYEALIEKEGIPFFPDGVDKDVIFGALVISGVLACAALFGPAGPNGPPNPTLIDTVPRPDFYFLSLFAVFALLPAYTETFVIVYLLPVAVVALFAIPFVSRAGEKHPSRRPGAVVGVLMIMTILSTLAYLGLSSPWSPHMDAWTRDPVPVAMVKGRSPLALQGAAVLQGKQCRNCHSLDGIGGQRGPDLSDVAARLTNDQLIRQVLQGGGNMPAYGHNLSPSEVTALVAFLGTLKPAGEPDAANAAQRVLIQ
ncbi:cytochrome b N-terminal domain-containing protein [Myxococcota bacterium]|nr:cytochrome b N-terminal domain-containing protein [Myxococcota bacterium]